MKKREENNEVSIERLVTHKEVQEITNRGRSTIHEWVKRGKFPQPVRTQAGTLIGWKVQDVQMWIEGKDQW